MSFTNGGGFVQAQPQIVATDFTSSNFSNTNQTGFDLNSGNTTNPDGTPPNTIQVYSGFQVGPTTGTHLDLTYTGGQAQLELFTGLAGEAVSASVFAEPYSPSPTIPALVVESAAMTNGFTQLILIPSDNASGGVNDVGRAILGTVGTTAPPTGGNTLTGVLEVGNAAADVWAVVISNENSVSTAQPGLVIGDTFTPRSRMFVSPSEIKSVDGSGNPETLWLNETNTEANPGPVANTLMRTNYSRDTAGHGSLTSTGFVTVGSAILTFKLPASGCLQIHHKTRITTGVSGQTYQADVIVKNTTASTTPYAGSTNNCFNWSGTTSASGVDISGFIAVGGPGGMGGTLGATGDTITVQVAYAVTGGTWAIGDTALMVTPSL